MYICTPIGRKGSRAEANPAGNCNAILLSLECPLLRQLLSKSSPSRNMQACKTICLKWHCPTGTVTSAGSVFLASPEPTVYTVSNRDWMGLWLALCIVHFTPYDKSLGRLITERSHFDSSALCHVTFKYEITWKQFNLRGLFGELKLHLRVCDHHDTCDVYQTLMTEDPKIIL